MRKLFNHFIQLESSAGILLGVATLVALLLANSPLRDGYQTLLAASLTVGEAHFSLLHFINDGLMTVFFFLVSLEIKRELMQGELNSVRKALLPTVAAIGGMLVPALLYGWVNRSSTEYLSGWAIPMATDIAFSLGVLSLLNHKIPRALKVFLTALAIIDDLGAILVIAIFYTQQIVWLDLLWASFCVVALLVLNYKNVNRFRYYLLFALPLWFFILQSGVHATIAGVIAGLTIPLMKQGAPQPALLTQLEHRLHPWTAFAILPLFAFANAGLSFAKVSWADLLHPLPLGIILGLFLGKQLGIMSACWIAIKAKWAKLPSNMTWTHLHGTALICGIGFTMSLFIANLTFSTEQSSALVRLGVLAGSALSAIAGYALLSIHSRKKESVASSRE